MILVDASVVIDWSQGKDAKLQQLMPSLPVAVCGVTQAELLHGSRDPAHRQRLLADLATLQFLPIPDALWITIGDNLGRCDPMASPSPCPTPSSPPWELRTI
jgi:predicted nucleic acid-binding protein